MRNRAFLRTCIVVALGVSAGIFVEWQTRNRPNSPEVAPSPAPVDEPKPEVVESTPDTRRAERMALTEAKLMRKLRQALQRKDARPNELILGFKDAAALRRFLERSGKCGVSLLKALDKLNLARVRIDDLAAFENELNTNGGDYLDLDANLLVFPPTVPEQEERVAATQLPFHQGFQDFIGMTGDNSQWGAGVTVAVIDSGVAVDATFGAGKVRYLDVGMGIAPTGEDGHGTGVAALVSGRAADAMGVAPGADILSIRVTGADGLSDGFTLMQAITAAADNGARVINVSLGAYGSSPGLASAIEYAKNMGSVIVASAGNDQVNQLTWPAAHPGVIAVGAVDAGGKQVMFSNSGEGLTFTAPGYGVPTAWIDSQRVYADGTSFSAPIVSGSIAALMTMYNTTAAQAAAILQQTASDGGPAGMDPDYGYGTVNMMWAQHYNDPRWFDTAISSHYVNPATGSLDVIVQNRGSIGVSGMQLELAVNGRNQGVELPWMGPGATFVTSVPINNNELIENGKLEFKTTLANPNGQNDGVPSNNFKGSSLSVAK